MHLDGLSFLVAAQLHVMSAEPCRSPKKGRVNNHSEFRGYKGGGFMGGGGVG